MVNFYDVFVELSETFGEAAAHRLTRILQTIAEDQRNAATREDLGALRQTVAELGGSVRELAEAQRRTDERIAELAEAQKRTDERIAELTEAQRRTDERLAELAEAQRRTDERIAELTEAQRRTDKQIAELTEAQRRTEERLAELARSYKDLSERVEGLSNSVGYSLENRAYRALPAILAAHGVIVEGRLIRRYIGELQLNVYGQGRRNGQPVTILGECKVRPSKKEIDRFGRIVERLVREGR